MGQGVKKVLVLVGIPNFDYQSEISAVAAFLRTIRDAFETSGYTVTLGNGKEEIPSNTQVAGPPSPGRMRRILRKFPYVYHSLSFRQYLKRHQRLIQEYEEMGPHDLVVEFHTAGSSLGYRLQKKWKCKLSVIFDSPVDEQFFEMHGTKTFYWKTIQRSEQMTMEGADRIMAYSLACSDYLKKRYKPKTEPIILPCVVEKPVVENHPSKETFNILFIGSFLSWHRLKDLVEAFKKLHLKIPEGRLQLIGFGQEWEAIKEQVRLLKLEERVIQPGFVSEEELIELKRDASVGIMPGSNWYGSPLKIFEYAAAGIPIVAPSTPTVQGIFESEKHCLFIDPKSTEESIFDLLIELHANPKSRIEMGKRAQEYVKDQFEGKKYQDQLVNALIKTEWKAGSTMKSENKNQEK